MNTLAIHHHLGLGDHIICNGLVRYFTQYYKVILFCKHKNIYNVSVMFSDIKNLSLIGVENDNEASQYYINNNNIKCLRLGVVLNKQYDIGMLDQWDKVFYMQANIDFDLSWKIFQINKPKTQNVVPSTPYIFMCRKGSDNIDRIDWSKIDSQLKIVECDKGGFFDNIDLIQNAQEIHCVDSSYIQ